MPDHFHVLITPTITLERALQLIKGGFSFRATKELGFLAVKSGRPASMIGGCGISKSIMLFGSTFTSILSKEGWLLCRRNIFSARRGRDLIWIASFSG